MMDYKVYMHTFPNGKVYIGVTKQKTKKRWSNGTGYKGQFVYNAIEKYQWKNVEHKILFEDLTKEEAEQKEIELIEKYKSNQREYGYNISNGGQCSDTFTEETRKKISKLKKGKPRPPEVMEKLRLARLNYKMSEENKKKMSIRLKQQYLGTGNPFYGKKHTEETKKIMSLNRSGHKNPNYNKGKKVICIETNEIFRNGREAQEKTNIICTSILKCCNKKQKTAGNLHWEFYKEMI